jgi:LPXTG-site transpeptidase (sortase) family protein
MLPLLSASYGRGCVLKVEVQRSKLLANVLIAVGALLLLYVGGAYLMMWHEQRTLSRQWQRDHKPTDLVQAMAARPVTIDDGLVRVRIAKADVDAIVVDGVTRRVLAVGPGHIPSTPMPGAPGNSVISAHRDTFFRHIGDLRNGDEVVVHRAGEVYHFAVTGRKIVKPDDLSVLRPTRDAQLTLITCYPTWFIGPAPERLVVTSQLVRSEPDSQ